MASTVNSRFSDLESAKILARYARALPKRGSCTLIGYDAEDDAAVVRLSRSYVLLERGLAVFSTPVPSEIVRASVDAGDDAAGIVRAAQRWMASADGGSISLVAA